MSEKKGESKRVQPQVLGRALRPARAPGDASKNECSKMSWKGKK